MISNGREPKSCLGQVFNTKLGHIAVLHAKCMAWHAATSRVENSAQGLSCQLKFVHVETDILSCWWNNDVAIFLFLFSSQVSSEWLGQLNKPLFICPRKKTLWVSAAKSWWKLMTIICCLLVIRKGVRPAAQESPYPLIEYYYFGEKDFKNNRLAILSNRFAN